MQSDTAKSKLILVMIIALAFSGCGRETAETTPQKTAYLRVINAIIDAPELDVTIGDDDIVQSLAFREVSDYAELPASTQSISVYAEENEDKELLINKTIKLEDGDYYTTLVIEGDEEPSLLLVSNKRTDVEMTKAKIRFINASKDAPAVDLRLATENKIIFENVGNLESKGYKAIDAGIHRLAATPTEKPAEPLLTVPGVQFHSNQMYTVIVIGSAEKNTLQAAVYQDT